MNNLRLEKYVLLDKLVAEKSARGYMLEITTAADDLFGFVSGYSEDFLQLIVIPDANHNGVADLYHERGNIKHKFGYYSIKDSNGDDLDYLQWVSIGHIQAITENRLRLDHFDSYSKAKIQRAQTRTVQRSEEFLKSGGK